MKNKNLFYGFAGILTILGFTLKIMHVENASFVLIFALVLGLLIQSWHVRQLEKRLEESGEHLNKRLAYGVGLLLIAGTATMKILHVTSSDSILLSPLFIGILVQSTYIRNLENKLIKKQI